ncbi:uncharacterized protein BDV14DRAFT_175148 [Aspergillus stella-maris]|uniref:uncharacterized protein n=1 Tax=Aspergillus stella-maris TaxID=1810926 RepID=UPI003CCD699F
MTSRVRSIPHILPLAPTHSSRRGPQIRATAFSTSAISLDKSSPSSTQKKEPVNPEVPRFSFEGLGISKNVKIVLYTLLSTWGAFETYFYYQAFMRCWRARSQLDDIQDVD